MPELSWGKMKTVNDWLQKSVAKERARVTGTPKAEKLRGPEKIGPFAPNPRLFKDARRSR